MHILVPIFIYLEIWALTREPSAHQGLPRPEQHESGLKFCFLKHVLPINTFEICLPRNGTAPPRSATFYIHPRWEHGCPKLISWLYAEIALGNVVETADLCNALSPSFQLLRSKTKCDSIAWSRRTPTRFKTMIV